MTREVDYKFTIRFPNGYQKVKKIPIQKHTLPFMVMRLRQQYVKAFIDWESVDGDKGTTELGAQ